jgi:hypothetical protein
VRTATFLSGSGTSSFAIRSAKPSTTAVLPTPASPVRDRVVLPAPGQDVDDLSDFEVSPEDRVDLPGARLGREVLGVLIQGLGPGGHAARGPLGRARRRRRREAQCFLLLGGTADDVRELLGERFRRDVFSSFERLRAIWTRSGR